MPNLQESTHSCKKTRLQQMGLFVDLHPVAEGGQRHPALLRRRRACDFPGLPPLVGAVVTLRERSGWPAEPDTSRFRRRDALRLPLPDVCPLVLRHEGEHLQDDVAEKGAHQVLAPAGVEQGHVQHHNVHALLLGENPPLFQNFAVVAPETVDALDVEQIVFFHVPHQLLVLGPLEVFSRLLVHENVPLRDGHLPQGDDLTILVLFPSADADVSVCS